MRFHLHAMIFGILLLAFGGANAALASDVLVPSGSTSNLGLSPSQGFGNDTQSHTATPTPAQKSEAAGVTGSAPVTQSTPKSSTPTLPKPVAPQAKGPSTRIFDMPAPAAGTGKPKRPHTLDAAISPESTWGIADSKIIGSALGLSPEEIPTRCHLSIAGMLVGGGGVDQFDTGLSTATSVGYSGAPKNAIVRIKALCDADQPPQNAGMVVREGGKYVILLGQVTCPMPPNPDNLSFQYTGNGQGQCAFK